MSSNVKVKTEPIDGVKKAGQGQFKPKLPPNKRIEKVEPISSNDVKPNVNEEHKIRSNDATTTSSSSSSSQIHSTSRRSNDYNRNSQDSRGQNRQKWVMPIGQSFFMSQKTSITNKKPKSKNPNETIPSNQQQPQYGLAGNVGLSNPIQPQFSSHSMRKIVDDYDDGNEMNPMMHMGSYNFGVYNDDDELNDTDTGSDSSDSDEDMEEKQDVLEIWPPQKYDLLEPLSLPLGPVTDSKRDELERQAIIYHPDDVDALEREKSDIFLLQFPSDLCLKGNIAAIEIKEDDKDDEGQLQDTIDEKSLKEAKKVEGKIGPGKLGKLQLTKSGKVFLVTDSGHKFEVHNGITACFANFVAEVALNENYNNTIDDNIDDKRNKKPTYNTMRDKIVNDNAPISGELKMLGRITKKLVITPDYYCS